MNGSALSLINGIVPLGNVMHFLYPHQYAIDDHSTIDVKFPDAVLQNSSEVNVTYVNFVLQPRKSYFDPFGFILEESDVEHGLEKMLSLESVGISDTDDRCSKLDEMKVIDFKNQIQFKDHKYHVALPWYEEKVEQVPSNYEVTLSVLKRAVAKFLKKWFITCLYGGVQKSIKR